jgi:hypothetical protein
VVMRDWHLGTPKAALSPSSLLPSLLVTRCLCLAPRGSGTNLFCSPELGPFPLSSRAFMHQMSKLGVGVGAVDCL